MACPGPSKDSYLLSAAGNNNAYYSDELPGNGEEQNVTEQHVTNVDEGISVVVNDDDDVRGNESLPPRNSEVTALSCSIWRRMPNTAWGISLGLAGNAIMWKKVTRTDFIAERIDASIPNSIFWYASTVAAAFVGVAYLYKLMFRFALVKREWSCPDRIHFMNAPNLVLLMLAMSIPPHIPASLITLRVMWTIGFAIQTILTQFIYEVEYA